MKCYACGSNTDVEDWYEIKATQFGGGLCSLWAVRRPERQISINLIACPICNTTKITNMGG
jgi:RNA polymerase subunit RPABC4/transcription elongation factor Spt4